MTRSRPVTPPTPGTMATTNNTTARKPRVEYATTARTQPRGRDYAFTPEKDTWDGRYEFGGPVGAISIMAFSHVLVYYMWLCVVFFKGAMIHPWHPALVDSDQPPVLELLATHAVPSPAVLAGFVGFIAFELVLAAALPGPIARGLPVPSENGFVHTYKCNGVYAWYVILATLALGQVTGVFPLSTIQTYYGQLLTSAVIVADVLSLALYVHTLAVGRQIRMSGNHVYDFFAGAVLNPKVPGTNICMKLFAEIRNSWVLTFVLGLSAAAKMYEDTGAVTPNMCFILTAYLLYTNACQKGEECIPTTWDIHHEKFGWMLIFWNTCGVAFTYSLQAMYLAHVEPHLRFSAPVVALQFALLFAAYFVWDTTNAQKNRFRMERVGVEPHIVRRRTFPQLPFGYIPRPRVITSDRGTLFVDGWYRYARKLHYTMDTIMAVLWASSCGASSLVPWFYPCFFVGMILDRESRDTARSAAKYGALWDAYVKLVPYRFIPGVW
uniref:Delta(24(24(1)))-sterol reductase n=1 Tax=Neobodo designis TaxID=312471 RepID=A0A7S1LM92_NEODS|mmetsp:Transcript_24765/g.76585  ORF Transcript_24765/g.76585 Transcript_24765/m.76585 type:complete len:494 (+) Transcript_24765:171-1652(+)